MIMPVMPSVFWLEPEPPSVTVAIAWNQAIHKQRTTEDVGDEASGANERHISKEQEGPARHHENLRLGHDQRKKTWRHEFVARGVADQQKERGGTDGTKKGLGCTREEATDRATHLSVAPGEEA